MKISDFQTSKELEEKGTWVNVEGTPDGTQFLVARIGSDTFDNLLAKKLKPFKRLVQKDKMKKSQQNAIMNEVIVETVLLGWKNLFDDDGNEVAFSKEKALELLKLKDFRELVVEIASTMEIFKAEEDEADEKNS